MKSILKSIGIAVVLPLTGCDLGSLAQVYNLTSCPVTSVNRFSDLPDEVPAPILLTPGSGEARLSRKPTRYEQIVIVDEKKVEHRYDSEALAKLRPPGAGSDAWAYTDQGLIFLGRSLDRSETNRVAEKPCEMAPAVQQ